MLQQRFSDQRLKQALIPRENWHPLPAASERDFWEALPGNVRQAYIRKAKTALDYAWPPLPATLFLEFARNGNRSRYEKQSFARRDALAALVLGECMEGGNRFVDDVVNGIWAICEESFWGVPAHLRPQKEGPGLPDIEDPIVPLFVGETASLLAWTLYLLGPQLDAVSLLVRRRVHLEIDRRVLTPCLQRDDFHWMGFPSRKVNNWNPWLNSNWLTTALLMERKTEKRLAAVAKSMRSLDNFIDHYPDDGGCDEGPMYWGRAGASLFDCLELLLSATDGVVDVYNEPLVRKIGAYIYKAQISGNYFINFADAPARLMPSPSLLFRYGNRIDDRHMKSLGAWAACEQHIPKRGFIMSGRLGSLGRQLAALPTFGELTTAEAAQPLPRDVWFPNIQVMTARDHEGHATGLYLAAKGGHNKESHNHNDIGNFIVYTDGQPLVIDVGVETYRAQTFSSERYNIWTMQSAFHNLPTINGVMQQGGREFAARGVDYAADDTSARLSLDLSGAYPPETGLKAWQRTVTLIRGRCVEIRDHYALTRPAKELLLSLLTPCTVRTDTTGILQLDPAVLAEKCLSGSGQITFDAEKLIPTVEEIQIEDKKLRGIWGTRLRRIVFTAREPAQTGEWLLQITQPPVQCPRDGGSSAKRPEAMTKEGEHAGRRLRPQFRRDRAGHQKVEDTPRALFTAVMDGRVPARPPVAAKIWVDLACRITKTPFIDALNDPILAMRTIVDACLATGMDAARVFTFPFRKVELRDGKYIHVDRQGRRIGTVDIDGGWATHCDDPADRDIARDEVMMSYHHFATAEPILRDRGDLGRMAVPTADYLERIGFGKAVDALRRDAGDRIALVGDCGSGTLGFHVSMRGMTQALIDFVDDPALLNASMERGVNLCLERARFFLNHGLRLLRYNDSVANMSVISPDHWRSVILPHLKRFCTEVHRMQPDARVYCHICGNTLPIIEDLATSGLDCIAPLDPLGGMTVAQVRERVGRDMPLMGGIDTQSFANAPLDAFTAEANRCLDAGAAGPYVLGSGCVVPRTACVDNLRAMRPIAEAWTARRHMDQSKLTSRAKKPVS